VTDSIETTSNVRFHATLWDEVPVEGSDLEALPRLARVHATNEYEGGITGTSILDYTFLYVSETFGTYVGFEQVTGAVDGREGSFCLRHEGTFDMHGITLVVSVVEGSGTGELSSLRGHGSLTAAHGEDGVPLVFSRYFVD